jgi:hypothetical protein
MAAGRKWVSWDVNAGTKAEMQEYLDSENVEKLRQKLETRLEFGTAGLRAAMGSGLS